MSWPSSGSIPPEVTALRDMLGNCNSWTSNGGGVNQVHYPDFAETTATFPAALIIRETYESKTYAAGGGALHNGSLRVEIYVDDDICDVEQMANGIASELAALQTGLPVISTSAGMAEDIPPGRIAAIADGSAVSYRGASILVTYGLSV